MDTGVSLKCAAYPQVISAVQTLFFAYNWPSSDKAKIIGQRGHYLAWAGNNWHCVIGELFYNDDKFLCLFRGQLSMETIPRYWN